MKWTRLLAGALAALALSGCTLVPATDTPHVFSDRSVPFSLTSPTIPFSNVARVTYSNHLIYLVNRNNKLRPVNRLLPSPATLLEVLTALALGPSAMESSEGYTTATPVTVRVDQATIANGVASIDLNQVLAALSPSQQRDMVAQFVFSALGSGAVNGIEITLYQEPFSLTINGQRVSRFTPALFQSYLAN